MQFTRLATAALVASISLVAAPQLGAQINASAISAGWDDALGAPTTIVNAAALSTARWGSPVNTGGPQSGYNFAPNTLAAINPITPGAMFDLGTFTHLNNPVFAPSLTSINLDFTLAITGAIPVNFTQSFVFNHLETPNNAATCANGMALGVGVNEFGCADRVTFAFAGAALPFAIGLDNFFLEIIGFEVDGMLTTDFWTRETRDNDAVLVGRITTDDPNVVPEPSTVALLALGMSGLGIIARRRRSA